MKIAEFFAAIGFKIEGADQLKAVETSLKNITVYANQAIAAVTKMNGMKVVAPRVVTPGTTPAPTAAPNATPPAPTANPNAYPTPIGPPLPSWLSSSALKQKAANLKALKEAITPVTVALSAMVAGMVALIAFTEKTALAIKNFTLVTGQSGDALQRWQAQARAGGASANDALGAVKALQSAIAQISIGEGNIAPFQFLGITPDAKRDIFTTLEQIKDRVRRVKDDPASLALTREFVKQLGVSDDLVASWLKINREYDRALFLSKEQVNSVDEMRAVWTDVFMALSAVKDKLVSAIAKPLKLIGELLFQISRPFLWFLNALTKSKAGMWALGTVLAFVGVGLALVAAGLVAVVTGLGAAIFVTSGLTAAMGLFGVTSLAALGPALLGAIGAATSALVGMASAWIAALAPVLVPLVAIVAILGAAVLVVQDLWTFFTGGDSFIGRILDDVKELGQYLADLIPDWMINLLGKGYSALTGGGGSGGDAMSNLRDQAISPRVSGGMTSANQTNSIQVNVSGSDNPRETGKQVAASINQEISDAAYQMPVLSY